MVKKATINQYKYDSSHCRFFRMKLNLSLDADIIEKLSSVPSMQGYIKKLIRDDIARTKSAPDTRNEQPFFWDNIVSLMDDEIRKSVHSDLAPCSNVEFLQEYKKRHLEKFGEEFKY